MKKCNHRNPGGSTAEKLLFLRDVKDINVHTSRGYYCLHCGRLRIEGQKTLYPTRYVRKRKD